MHLSKYERLRDAIRAAKDDPLIGPYSPRLRAISVIMDEEGLSLRKAERLYEKLIAFHRSRERKREALRELLQSKKINIGV